MSKLAYISQKYDVFETHKLLGDHL